MQRVKAWLRSYFGFSTRESNGFLVLMGLVIGLLFLPQLYTVVYPTRLTYQPMPDRARLDSLVLLLEQQPINTKQPSIVTYFYFDPNLASKAQFIQLGLAPFLAERIVRYREKGGRFRTKQDLKKIYGLSDEEYNVLEKWITIENGKQALQQQKSQSSFTPSQHILSDLNKADTTELKKINGIGSKLAVRILKFRDKLGGFVTAQQVYEVYGLDSAVVARVLKNFYVLPDAVVQKLAINSLSADSLAQHPYVGRKLAWAIVNYRKQNGKYTGLADIAKIKTTDENWLKKIQPYLSYE